MFDTFEFIFGHGGRRVPRGYKLNIVSFIEKTKMNLKIQLQSGIYKSIVNFQSLERLVP